MKRMLSVLFILIVSMVTVFADTHLGGTETPLSDNSFVVQAYYKGTEITNNDKKVDLSFKDRNGNPINHNTQSTTGTTVAVSSSYQLSTDETVFSWLLSGKNGRSYTVNLSFTFTTLQAEVNEHFYRPTYTLKMAQGTTRKGSETGADISSVDTFYSSTEKIVGEGSTTGLIADQDTQFTKADTITYSGKINLNKDNDTYKNSQQWYRSGTCKLNISAVQEEIPGNYHYVCWVVVEVSVV